MPVEWGDLGGQDDVYLAGDLPDLGMWRIDELPLLDADEIGGHDEFPYNGAFALATELETGREIYVQITEGLQGLIDEQRAEEPVTQVGVEIDTAEKAGEEEMSPWRYSGSVAALGPPDGQGP